MIGVDLGGTSTKVCYMSEDGEMKLFCFPTKIEEIKKFFNVDENMNLSIPSIDKPIKGWSVTGGGSHKFRTFFEKIIPKPSFVDELTVTSLGAQHMLKDPNKLHVIGDGNSVD